MLLTRSAVLLVTLVLSSSLLSTASTHDEGGDAHATRQYRFLLFASITGGSHYIALCKSGRVLVRQGHRVVSLVSSSNSNSSWQKDADLFSFVVFNSTYTKQHRNEIVDNIGRVIVRGHHNSFWGPYFHSANLTGRLSFVDMWLQECDDLLGDAATMERLRGENFDMLVVDDVIPCGPLLAQALNIPFIHNSVYFANPSKHGCWAGLPIEPSYVPELALGLTNKMTFLQRVQNTLAHYIYGFIHFRLGLCKFDGYDKLKIKYNIKPEISTLESYKQAVLYFLHGSFALEFPRPLQPNTIVVLHNAGLHSNETLKETVSEFLDTAPAGAILFSMGTFITAMERHKAQVFADAFSRLPYRVLWQSGMELTGLQLGNNTMVVKWLPMTQVMEHANIRLYVGQGGSLTVHEALWAGLPIVGLPLVEDMMDNMVPVETKGAGLSLDIGNITPDTLSQSIVRVMTEPRFRKNALRISKIMRDLEPSTSPVDTIVHWILHVTRFGGAHLRPAVQDLSYIQRNLLDVYLFLAVIVASVCWINVSVCCFCFKRMRTIDRPKDWGYRAIQAFNYHRLLLPFPLSRTMSESKSSSSDG
ncbi:UDP-glucuronosyltransferase 2B20-like [Acanthaster planci]|uniref:UDP-glucuronosyltransferase 2B20-like n=1 Tax=Acanthaster planci TaxID=133434 RepID=A0A8B7Z1V6_ACAPL|nr:UDP-glucuronosyltransferase 2B20-like [Acanthaster planci]